MDKKLDWFYSNRDERAKWIVERFSDIFNDVESVLDVGCWRKNVKKYLREDIKYVGIDIAGDPDIFLDLDRVNKLPFDDGSFDVVICADVLEHLENIHLIFDEMCRVSRKYVIITLPNPANQIFNYIFKRVYANTFEKRKRYGKYSKFYGLPLEKPDDRHRWFFSYDEAIEFVEYRATKCGFRVKIIEDDIKYRKLNIISNLIYHINKNIVISSIIFLLEREKDFSNTGRDHQDNTSRL